MMSIEAIQKYFKKKHDLAIGEITAGALSKDLKNLLNMKVKVPGRSYTTGRKKTVTAKIKDLI